MQSKKHFILMDVLDFMKTKVLLIKRNEWFYIELKMYKSRQYGLE
jgi:hypothetical protein